MRTLIVLPDFQQQQAYHFPLGIPYVSSYLKSKGHDITAFNANHYAASQLDEVLSRGGFDVVATGGLFVHAAVVKSLVDRVREKSPRSKVVLGGALVAGDPEYVFDALKPDHMVLGEGETVMEELLKTLAHGGDLAGVAGIAYKANGRFVRTEAAPLIESLDSLPFPDYEGFEFGRFLDSAPKRIANIISSRDCVSKCTFCFRMMGGKFRLRSLANLMGEIHYLRDKYQIKEVGLLDDMFAADKNRVMEFCRLIKPLGIPWTCQLRVNIVDDQLLSHMKDAGCHFISYGFESGSSKVLKSMRKGVTPQQIDHAIQATLKANITIQGNFIFGDPAEDLKTVEETIRFTRKFSKLNIGYGHIIPYPGTVLYHDLVRRGGIKDRWAFFLNPTGAQYNMTSLSDIDYAYLKRKVFVEGLWRRCQGSGRIVKFKKIRPDVYDLSIRCQLCGTVHVFEKFNRDQECSHFICKNCYQRVFWDEGDLRFMDIACIRHRFVGLYIWGFICSSPGLHRCIEPILMGIKKINSVVKKTLRG